MVLYIVPVWFSTPVYTSLRLGTPFKEGIQLSRNVNSVKKQRYEQDFNSYLNDYLIPTISKKAPIVQQKYIP